MSLIKNETNRYRNGAYIYENFKRTHLFLTSTTLALARAHTCCWVWGLRARVCACAVDNPVLERWRRLLQFFRAYENGFFFFFSPRDPAAALRSQTSF